MTNQRYNHGTMMMITRCNRKATAITVFDLVAMYMILFMVVYNNSVDAFPIIATATTLKHHHQQQATIAAAATTTPCFSINSSSRLYAVENGNSGNNNILQNIFSSLSSTVLATTKKVPLQPPKYENVIIEPDYRIAALFLGFGLLLDTIPYIQLTIGPFITLLGALFLFQSFRIRFVFTDENQFELKTISPSFGNNSGSDNNSDDDSPAVSALNDSGENVIVGGANRWDCTTIVNYDFFPRQMMDLPLLGQPVLIYFKETQTPESSWNEGPGKSANDPEKIANGTAISGQVHFFPAICNAKQMEREFQKRNVQKL